MRNAEHELAMARAQARAAKLSDRKRAAFSASSMIERVLRDEAGVPLRQAPFHKEWQDTIDANNRVVLFAPVRHGKTVQVCVGRTLWELGSRLQANQYPRILLVSNTQKQASKPFETVKAHIERNFDLHRLFPKLTRERFDKWTGSFIRYKPERPTTAKDFTLEAVGVGGAVLGGRYDLVILDGILDMENTWTHEQRFKGIQWYEATIPGRMVTGGKILVVDTAWHPGDTLHHLAKLPAYVVRRYPAHDPKLNPMDPKHRAKIKPIWPEGWSPEELAAFRAELTPYRYAQQVLCKAVTDDTSRFDPDWFTRCINQGKGLPFPAPRGMEITVTGVDLGVKRKATSNETALFTAGVDAETGKRRILDIDHGRWKKREIIERCKARWRKYGGIFMVEDVGAQNYLIQDLQEDTPIPVWPYVTKGPRKHDPVFGIESWGVELENRKWEIPADRKGRPPASVQLWIDQCMEWKPMEHAGDILMAGYFALEGIRRHEMIGEGGGFVVG